jgi:hypothetical protein
MLGMATVASDPNWITAFAEEDGTAIVSGDHDILGEKEEVRHAQGACLTRCTPKLYALIRTDVFGKAPDASAQSARTRYWAMALGEGGRLWDECQEKGIAAIGWDEFELGDLTKYPDRESIQKILIEKRGVAGPTPSNDALCLFQFSHEMAYFSLATKWLPGIISSLKSDAADCWGLG